MFKGFKTIQEWKESYYSSLDEFPESYKKILKQAENNIAKLLKNQDWENKVLVIETDSKGINYKDVKFDNLYKEEVKNLLGENKKKITKDNVLKKSESFDNLEIGDVKKSWFWESVQSKSSKTQNSFGKDKLDKADLKKTESKGKKSFQEEKKNENYFYVYIVLFLLLIVLIIIFQINP